MTMKVGLSGFGRIGRDVVRIIFEEGVSEFELVALNASGNLEDLAHLFKYDSTYRKFKGEIETYEEGFIINGKKIPVVNYRDPAQIPWKDLGVELVIDSTGAFKEKADLEKHIQAGAKKVMITAPAKNEDITIVMGVNDDLYDPEKHNIISNASCTTNCLAPVSKVILDNFQVKKGLMTTIHAYTNDTTYIIRTMSCLML